MCLEKPAVPVGYSCVLRGIASGNDMRRRMRRHAPFKNQTGPERRAWRTGRILQHSRSGDDLRMDKGNRRPKVHGAREQKCIRRVYGAGNRSDQRRAAGGRFLNGRLLGIGIMRAANALFMMLGGRIDDCRPGAVITRHEPRQSETTKRRQLDQPRLSDCVHPSLVPHPDLFCNGENFCRSALSPRII